MPIDVYVFSDAPPTTVDRFGTGGDPQRMRPGVDKGLRYIAAVTGDRPIFAVLEVTRLSQVADLQARLGLRSETAVAVAQFAPMYTKKSRHYPYSAFVRLWIRPSEVKQVLTAAGGLPGNCGATSVHGVFDGIVDFGAKTQESLNRRLDDLLAIPEIVRADQMRVMACAYRDPPKFAKN